MMDQENNLPEEECTHKFQKKVAFQKRLEESRRIRTKHPNRIPIIIERSAADTKVEDIDKNKFLVPNDLTIGQLMYVVRKRLKTMNAETGLFFFINNSMPSTGTLLSTVYSTHKHDDGFLYVLYAGENTFG